MTQNFFIDIVRGNSDTVLRFFRGDTHTLKVYVMDDGEIFDLSSYTAVLSVKKEFTDAVYQFQLSGADVSYDTAAGLITFSFGPSDTENMSADTYLYDVQISDGTATYTILQDVLQLNGDVTAPAISTINPNGYVYIIGNETTDGSWRMTATLAGNLKVQIRVSGTWTTIGEFYEA